MMSKREYTQQHNNVKKHFVLHYMMRIESSLMKQFFSRCNSNYIVSTRNFIMDFVSKVTANFPSVRNLLLGDPDDTSAHSPTILNQLVLALVVIVVFMIIYKIIDLVAQSIQSRRLNSPFLESGTKDAKHEVVVSQNPEQEGAIPLRRSLNENDGLEFSYNWWMFIEDYDYKRGSWKHVFHKGNADAYPLRAPGVWLHPTENKMYFYMNSYKEIQNEVIVDNIPISKWFHVSMVVGQETMDIYINGFLKVRKSLNGIARQNFGDVYINSFGGFSGYISRMRYYGERVPLSQIQTDVNEGPSMKLPYSSQQQPPYLTPYWWVNEYE